MLSAFTHRMRVDFPEPEGPMMQTTSPFMTSKLTPRSTSSSPNDLCTSRMETIGWLGSQFVSFIPASRTQFRSELHREPPL